MVVGGGGDREAPAAASSLWKSERVREMAWKELEVKKSQYISIYLTWVSLSQLTLYNISCVELHAQLQ